MGEGREEEEGGDGLGEGTWDRSLVGDGGSYSITNNYTRNIA